MRGSWELLAALRGTGKKPRLPVIITLDKRDAWNMFTPAFFVLVHQPGTRFHAHLLDGLEVILRMPCAEATAIAALIRRTHAKPARVEAWCACAASLTVVPYRNCTEYRDELAA